jgi:hypothetical protein
MKKSCLTRTSQLIVATCLFLIPAFAALAQPAAVSLYVSKQSGQASNHTGSYSKTTDKYEDGTVDITTAGPITYSITPNELHISTEETKNWEGQISADVDRAPEPGQSESAMLYADYTIHYSRPYGSGTSGSVQSTYYCSSDGSAAGTGGCEFHESKPGAHEMVEETGQQTKGFYVMSILADLPDTICLGAAGQRDVTAISYPADGGNFKWTCNDPSVTITNGDQRMANIKMADPEAEGIVVEVEFEIGGVTYKDQGVLSNCECGCKPITTIQPGPLTITFDAQPQSQNPDANGNCQYTASDAKFTLQMNGIIQRQIDIPGGANVTFGRNCITEKLTEVTVGWTGDLEIPKLAINGVEVIKMTVKEVNLTVGVDGNLDGSVKVKVENPEDKDIMGDGMVWLRKGTSSEITFKFNNENGFNGDFDFSGIQNIKLEIVKKKDGADVTIADFTGNMDKDGLLKGDFTAKPNSPYKTSNFTVDVTELKLGLEVKVQTGEFKLTSGSGKATVKDIKGLTGTVDLSIAFANGNGTATIAANADIKAFTMVFSNLSLTVDFNSKFDITKVQGTLKAKHEKFNTEVNVTEFVLEDGSLSKFSASGEVKYSGFKFKIDKSEYVKTPSSLAITGMVALNVTGTAASVEVKDFKIGEGGEITIGSIEAQFTRAPASFKANATFGQNRFQGTFTGDFAAIGLDGSIDVGSQENPDFNFGYFSIAARANVPLGNSGLKLFEIGGSAGFNYEINFPGGGGNPAKDNYVVGLKLGVSDMADMCAVKGETVIQFNTATGGAVVTLNGSIDVLKNNRFFGGTMNVNYRIPANTVDGRVGAEIKIPSSGFIVSTNNCNVDFNLGGGSWSANGNGMGGQMFGGKVQLSGGHINMSGPLGGGGGSMSGTLGGQASAGFGYSLSVSALGNSVTGNINFNMNANINAGIDQNGLSGTFGINANGNGTLTFDTWLGSQTFQGSAIANGQVGYNGGTVSLSGTVDVTLPISIPFYGNQISTGVNISI